MGEPHPLVARLRRVAAPAPGRNADPGSAEYAEHTRWLVEQTNKRVDRVENWVFAAAGAALVAAAVGLIAQLMR